MSVDNTNQLMFPIEPQSIGYFRWYQNYLNGYTVYNYWSPWQKGYSFYILDDFGNLQPLI